jgi:hypothetical protein
MNRHSADQASHDPLEQALSDLAWIRRHADDRCEHELHAVGRAYEDFPASERERMIAKACKPHRAVEEALTRQLADRLDSQTRREVFKRTLDPQFES